MDWSELPEAIAAAVRKLTEGTTRTEMESFSGLWNLSFGFVTNFSRVAVPINNQLQKDQLISFQSPSLSEEDAVQNQ